MNKPEAIAIATKLAESLAHQADEYLEAAVKAKDKGDEETARRWADGLQEEADAVNFLIGAAS